MQVRSFKRYPSVAMTGADDISYDNDTGTGLGTTAPLTAAGFNAVRKETDRG
jgi:hypothetical protein